MDPQSTTIRPIKSGEAKARAHARTARSGVARTPLLLAAACLATACSTPVLKSHPVNPGAETAAAGLVYSLPKAQVQMEVQRVKVDPEALKKAKKALAEAEATEAAAAKARSEAAAASQEALAIARHASGEGSGQAKIQLDLARARLKVSEDELGEAKALKKAAAVALAKAAEAGSEFEQSVVLKVLPSAPDRKMRFSVQLDHLAPSRDQNITLSVSNGLLSSSEARSTGQVGSILVSLAGAVSALGGVPGLAAGAGDDKAMAGVCEAKQLAHVFDPTDAGEVAEVQRQLDRDFDNSFQLISTALVKAAHMPEKLQSRSCPASESCPWLDGLAYRALLPLSLSVSPNPKGPTCSSTVKSTGAVLAASVPDASQYFVLPVDANSFTTAKTDIVFSEGLPITYTSEQPSQFAAIARIPVDMLKAAISVPAEMLKLRVDYSSQKAALSEKQAAELEALLKLLKAQEALADKQAAGKPDTASNP